LTYSAANAERSKSLQWRERKRGKRVKRGERKNQGAISAFSAR
jgi:hypothetical protein